MSTEHDDDSIDWETTVHPKGRTMQVAPLADVTALQAELTRLAAERDELKAEAALYENAQCIKCKMHLDLAAECEAEKTYTGQLLAKLEAAEARLQALEAARGKD
jgi:hypothetical protein